jgi:hypothetical protein
MLATVFLQDVRAVAAEVVYNWQATAVEAEVDYNWQATLGLQWNTWPRTW